MSIRQNSNWIVSCWFERVHVALSVFMLNYYIKVLIRSKGEWQWFACFKYSFAVALVDLGKNVNKTPFSSCNNRYRVENMYSTDNAKGARHFNSETNINTHTFHAYSWCIIQRCWMGRTAKHTQKRHTSVSTIHRWAPCVACQWLHTNTLQTFAYKRSVQRTRTRTDSKNGWRKRDTWTTADRICSKCTELRRNRWCKSVMRKVADKRRFHAMLGTWHWSRQRRTVDKEWNESNVLDDVDIQLRPCEAWTISIRIDFGPLITAHLRLDFCVSISSMYRWWLFDAPTPTID